MTTAVPPNKSLHPMNKKLLLIPLGIFALSFSLGSCSVRIGLIAHGYPLAHIVPKQQFGLGIFNFVDTDNLRAEALVFSEQHPIGWVYHGLDGTRMFVPFTGERQFDADLLSPFWLIAPFVMRLLSAISTLAATIHLFIGYIRKKYFLAQSTK